MTSQFAVHICDHQGSACCRNSLKVEVSGPEKRIYLGHHDEYLLVIVDKAVFSQGSCPN